MTTYRRFPVRGSATRAVTQASNVYFEATDEIDATNVQDAIEAITDGTFVPTFAGGNIGGSAYYAEFEADGTLELHGAATVWDDLRVDAATGNPGTSPPGFDTFLGGTMIYWFDKASDESIHFSVQLPHSWAGTAVYPHVHWVPKTSQTAQNVLWSLEYTWAEIGAVFPAATIVLATSTNAPANPVASTHYMDTFDAITPTTSQDGISSMMICRLFRDVSGDNYDDDAGLLEFDLHYEINTLGSRTTTAK